jgi:predicted DNA-binding WGR domain protein
MKIQGQRKEKEMTNNNTSKTVLVSKSEGARGNAGKKKVYEIVVEGNKVTLSWGMAEKANRQTKTEWVYSPASANSFAFEKQWEKIAKGYELAYKA